jgi:hypothetical protein
MEKYIVKWRNGGNIRLRPAETTQAVVSVICKMYAEAVGNGQPVTFFAVEETALSKYDVGITIYQGGKIIVPKCAGGSFPELDEALAKMPPAAVPKPRHQ